MLSLAPKYLTTFSIFTRLTPRLFLFCRPAILTVLTPLSFLACGRKLHSLKPASSFDRQQFRKSELLFGDGIKKGEGISIVSDHLLTDHDEHDAFEGYGKGDVTSKVSDPSFTNLVQRSGSDEERMLIECLSGG